MFARLATAPTAHRMEGHGRQRNAWERGALDAVRNGDIPSALEAYRQHGRVHTHPDQDNLNRAAVAAYLQARAEQRDPWQSVLLAASRDDVRHLNAYVRNELLARGLLGEQALQVDTDDGHVSYRTGDQVLVTRNDHRRGLLNGTAARVTAIGRDQLTLT